MGLTGETQGARPPPRASGPFHLPLHGPSRLRPASGTLLPSPWGRPLFKGLGFIAGGCCRSHLSPAPGTPSPAPGTSCLSNPCSPYRQNAPAGIRSCGRSGVWGPAVLTRGSAGWHHVVFRHDIPANLSHCPEASLGMWRQERNPLPGLVFGKAMPRRPRPGEG